MNDAQIEPAHTGREARGEARERRRNCRLESRVAPAPPGLSQQVRYSAAQHILRAEPAHLERARAAERDIEASGQVRERIRNG